MSRMTKVLGVQRAFCEGSSCLRQFSTGWRRAGGGKKITHEWMEKDDEMERKQMKSGEEKENGEEGGYSGEVRSMLV